MSLSNLYIDAFMAVAQKENFSIAAESLFVTQSALSQRIKKLEEELGQTLFIRESSGAKLTEAGRKLLIYGQNKKVLEEEVLNSMSETSQDLAGTIRIAAFSSVLRSVVIKSLGPFLRENPNINCEFKVAQMKDIPSMLQRAEVDIAILDYRLDKNGIVQETIGEEVYVLIDQIKGSSLKNTYLDHDSEDLATEAYFSKQTKLPKNYNRKYMGDIYGVIDGVSEGLGRAVVSKHLIKGRKELKIIKGMRPFTREVVLHHHEQVYYTKLHKCIVKELCVHSKKYL